ncbi:MAG: VWA domain-containing protein [Bryobacteraceae bacterium]
MRKILLVLCVSALAAAQNQPENQPLIRESVQVVQAPVTVLDKSGEAVTGLTQTDFHLLDNGKPQKITEDVALHPLSIVAVIQANNDVEAILPSVKRLGSVFENLVVGENGEIAVIGFDHRAQVLSDFTQDTAQIDAAFKKLRPGSYTAALNDATMKAINMLKLRPADRHRVLIQISENRDKGSEINVREVLTAADFASVQIYSVNVSQLIAALTSKAMPNRPSPIPPEAQWNPAGVIGTPTTTAQMNMGNWVPALKDIFNAAKGTVVPDPLDVYTRYTGGREYGFKNEKTLDRDVARIGYELHGQYVLTYRPNNRDEAGFHHITVEVDRPNLVVRTRDGYWIAGKPQ